MKIIITVVIIHIIAFYGMLQIKGIPTNVQKQIVYTNGK